MILISPNQTFSAENTIRTQQNVHRTNNTDEYGRKKANSFDFGRWSVKSGSARQCDSPLRAFTLVNTALFPRP